MTNTPKESRPEKNRRAFMKGAVASGGAALVSASCARESKGAETASEASEANAAAPAGAVQWDHVVDVVIVGSGVSGASAAITAADGGASVLILEKAPFFGGTSSKSGGVLWLPNNRVMRDAGEVDARDDAIKYMARASYPTLYNPAKERFGLPQNEFELIAAFYDNAGPAMGFFEGLGFLNVDRYFKVPDYLGHFEENKAPYLRGLSPRASAETGQFGVGAGTGADLMMQFRAGVDAKKIPVLVNHRVEDVLLNEARETAGVVASTAEGDRVLVRAKKGVVFCSGGFSHNLEYMRHFQPAPIYGSCSLPTSEGDFITIGQSVGAKLANLNNAWRAQVVLEDALNIRSVQTDVWQPAGDSMFLVNKRGERVVNEKRDYMDRTRVHFDMDANYGDYPNQFLFMIYDQRTADLYAGNFPLPAPDHGVAKHVISAASVEALTIAIQERLNSLSDRIGPFALDKRFKENLSATISKFNGYARKGKDDDFHRGDFPYDSSLHSMLSIPREGAKREQNPYPNHTLHPLQPEGPYYAIILAAGTLDTNGGPVINANAQVIHAKGRKIPGLYGAGNCIASPAGNTYWAAGATLGLGMTYGYIAGRNVCDESEKAAPTAASLAAIEV